MSIGDHEIHDIPLALSEVKERAKADFNFFSGLCIPDVMENAFPNYYIALWVLLVQAIEDNNKYQTKKILRYVIGLPRGFCKTTFLKCLVAWLVCYGYVRFVLIICATDPLAESFLSDLHNILKSDNIEKIFGVWQPATDRTDTKVGAYQRQMLILKARGAGTAVRGINEDNKRPDLILCDDMQTKENDASESDRAALFNWFVGTLLKTVTQKRSIVIYVGNMYSDHCILYLLKVNPHWVSLITGCLLESGESLWPELFSVEDLYESFIHDESLGKADVWFAEMMNDPVESADGLIHGAFKEREYDLIPQPDAAFVTVDPAGFRAASDENVIAAHYMLDARYLIAEMQGGIWTPKQTVENGLSMAVRHEASLIAVEAVAYQASLAFWFNHFISKEQITGIQAVPLKRPSNKTKTQFIRNFVSELYSGNYQFLRAVDRARFTHQAVAYRISRTKNKDDWLDCPAMGIEVRNQFGNMLSLRIQAARRQLQSARVQGNNTPF
jgi:hypothetical protein